MIDDISQRIFLGGGDFCAVYNRMSIHLAGGWLGTGSLHMNNTLKEYKLL